MIVSGLAYYFFRQYLKTVPPGSTTVNHYIFYSLTWAAQLSVGYVHILILASTFVQDSMLGIIESSPSLACTLLNPGLIGFPMAMHFTLMMAIKLYITVLPNRFMGMNHEKFWRCLQVTGLLVFVASIATKLQTGTLCNPKAALIMTNTFISQNITIEDFGQDINSNSTHLIPTPFLCFALACVLFLAASIIQAVKKKQLFRKWRLVSPKFTNKTIAVPSTENLAIPTVQPSFLGQAPNNLDSETTLQSRRQVHVHSLGMPSTVDNEIMLTPVEDVNSRTPVFNTPSVQSPSRDQKKVHVFPILAKTKKSSSSGTTTNAIIIPMNTPPVQTNPPFQVYQSQSNFQSLAPGRNSQSQESRPTLQQGANKQFTFNENTLFNPDKGQTKSSMKKVVQIMSFLSGFILTISHVLFITGDLERHMPVIRVVVKLVTKVLELMPVYWMQRMPEARNLMYRRLKDMAPTCVSGCPTA